MTYRATFQTHLIFDSVIIYFLWGKGACTVGETKNNVGGVFFLI